MHVSKRLAPGGMKASDDREDTPTPTENPNGEKRFTRIALT